MGGNNVMCVVGFGKESLSRSLSMSSMVHVEGIFCLGRRGGEIRDDGLYLVIFVYTCRGVEYVGRCWFCGGISWYSSWWVKARVCYYVGIIMAMCAMGCRASGGWCNISALCFGVIMLVGHMGWYMKYSSSSYSEDFKWRLI
jgi:hypothetical protein